jgi:PKHD-type hydroxylase
LGGEQRVDGFEAELVGSLTTEWKMRAGYSYLDSETTRSTPGGPLVGKPLTIAPLQIPAVLDRDQLRDFRQALGTAQWIDGATTAGHFSVAAKHNRQLPETHPLAIRLGNVILDALERHPTFVSFALPARIVPPLLNAYRGGEEYGRHIDGAVRPIPGHSLRIRTDLSMTLFLSEPHEYDGGELVIEEASGERVGFKLAAGTLLVYPTKSVHFVEPVTRGERLASFTWIQSLVRESDRRELLFSLDGMIQRLRERHPDDPPSSISPATTTTFSGSGSRCDPQRAS